MVFELFCMENWSVYKLEYDYVVFFDIVCYVCVC